MRRDWLKLLALLVPVLTGCLSHTHSLQQPKLAGVVLNADARSWWRPSTAATTQVNSLSATVDFAASVGGAHKGKQTDYTSIHGYILHPQAADAAGIGICAGVAHCARLTWPAMAKPSPC